MDSLAHMIAANMQQASWRQWKRPISGPSSIACRDDRAVRGITSVDAGYGGEHSGGWARSAETATRNLRTRKQLDIPVMLGSNADEMTTYWMSSLLVARIFPLTSCLKRRSTCWVSKPIRSYLYMRIMKRTV